MTARRGEPFELLAAADRAGLPPDATDAYPMTALQQGMLYEMARAPSRRPYHNCLAVLTEEIAHLTEDSLRRSVRALTETHPALRTSLHIEGFSEPLQIVHATPATSCSVLDWQNRANPETAIRAYVREQIAIPIDHQRPALARFAFFRLSERTGYLAITYSHAVLDGQSAMRVLSDLVGLLNEKPLPVRENAMPELVAQERAASGSGSDAEFWRHELEGEPGLRLLPRQCPGDGNPNTCRVAVEPDLRSRLTELADHSGVPLGTLFLAAHLRIVAMWAREGAATTGLACDVRPASPGAVGLFLNTIPLTLNEIPDTWTALIQAVHERETAALPHRNAPLTTIRGFAGERIPLDAWFSYVGDVERYRDRAEAGFTELPLAVTATPYELKLQTDDRYFDRAESERLATAYLITLRAMASESPPGPRHVQFGTLVTGETRPDQCRPLTEAFLRRATADPDAVAVLDPTGIATTYRALEERSRLIASGLRAAGVARGEVVGIAFGRSVELIAAILGVLRCGAAYLPLDPDLPGSRVLYMTDNASVGMVLADAASGAALDSAGMVTTPLSALGGVVDPQWTDSAVTADDLAYVLYTSGSTGSPKGVSVNHGGLGNLLAEVASAVRCGAGDVVSARTSLSFDIATVEFLMPLLTGASVALTSAEERDAAAFGRFVDDHGVTIAQATPSTWTLLMEQGWRPKSPEVRLLSAGEPLNDRLAGYLSRHAPLYNFYGPTEATVYVSVSRPRPGEPVTLGRPLANCELAVSDPHGALVPAGVVGELLIGGPGVARGYLNQPDLTSERFIEATVGSRVRRLYRSGDLTRELPSGEYEYLGRIDRQIKVRGYRIEPAEVEAVLVGHPDVRGTVVQQWAEDADPAGQRLVAFVVPDDAEQFDKQSLSGWAAEHLPHYMVPSDFVTIDAVPTNTNGKVDSGRLSAVYRDWLSRQHRARADRAPADQQFDDTERLLADEFAHVLRISHLRRDDNFFEIGGNSLSAMRLTVRLKALDIAVRLDDIFRHPTLAGLAKTMRPRTISET